MVARIGLQAGAPVGDAVTFPVVLVFPEGDGENAGKSDLELLPGMTGRAEIHSGE